MVSRVSLNNQSNFSSSFRARESKIFRWAKTCDQGHGRTGQVKRKVHRFERTIKILGVDLNRGSFIEFVNAVLKKQKRADEYLKKGHLRGAVGGSSDKKIRETFEKMMRLDDFKEILILLKNSSESLRR